MLSTCMPSQWRRVAGATVMAMVLARSACAADLTQQAAAVAVPAEPLAYDWTGFYLGGHIGYAWGNSNWTASARGASIARGSFSLEQPYNDFWESGSGFEGAQAGYNYMFSNRVVIGAEADAGGSLFPNFWNPHYFGLNIGGTSSLPKGAGTYSDTVYNSGTVRGRIGYAPGNWLFYATGGLAWTSEQFSQNQLAETRWGARLGWAAGGGIEAPFIPHWTVKAEYLYTSYGDNSVTFLSTGQRFTSDLSEQEFRAGLNYQFGDDGALSEKDAPKTAATDPDRINIHGEFTGIWQAYPAFSSPFSGLRSLPGGGDARETTDLGLSVGFRLWSGAEFWVNPEIDQGFGVGNTLGVAEFPSGGAYKIGQAEPYARIQRFFLRQEIDLGGETQKVAADFNQFAGTQTSDRLVLTVGRFYVFDIFDTNKYASNPKTQFLNWAYIWNLAWDLGSDSWGSAYGATAEWYVDRFAFRAGVFDMSVIPEGGAHNLASYGLTPTFGNVNVTTEIEERHELWGQPGKIKVLGSVDNGNMASISDAIASGVANNVPPDFANVRKYRSKPSLALNIEQQITPDLAFFARASWMNGQFEIYDSTDTQRFLSAGFSISGKLWDRPNDTIGVAGAVSGISSVYEAYLNAGGLGVLIGDGKLPHPGNEGLFETYYNYQLSTSTSIGVDYQFIANPAYNTDRGPANFFATRVHWQF